MFTVKQLSTLTGITPRTLHYYDEIGLLKPRHIGDNGYRYYGEPELLRLQQILFYRELDVPLADIRGIMGRADFDVLAALQSHKEALRHQATRLQRLIATVDNTILHLKGTHIMSKESMFAGLTSSEHRARLAEAGQKYGQEVVRQSQQRLDSQTGQQRDAIIAEGDAVYADMVAAMPLGPADTTVQAIVQRWRNHLQHFWTPQLDQLSMLARTYSEDARFKANFDKLDPRLAGFMLEAVEFYVAQHAVK